MSFEPVFLTDFRCQELWKLNDTELLQKIAERYPDILPVEEWVQITRHHDFIYGGPKLYREFIASRPGGPGGCEGTWEMPNIAQDYHNLLMSPRWQTIQTEILYALTPPKTILDLGCWIGVYGIIMSNIFPDAKVFLRDLSSEVEVAIKMTIASYAQNPRNLSWEIGDHLDPVLPRGIDLVYCGEVMEHVPDVDEFVRAIEAACHPGSRIIFTTPIESTYDTNNNYHVRHIERADLMEMFGHKPEFRIWDLGRWHLFTYEVPGVIGDRDWDRKLKKWGFD